VSATAGAVVVVVAALTMLFIGHARDAVVGTGPSALRTFYPTLDTFNVINPVAHGSGIDAAYGAGMLLAFAGWVGLLLLLGVFLFERRDL
jgi:hypothetical protein